MNESSLVTKDLAFRSTSLWWFALVHCSGLINTKISFTELAFQMVSVVNATCIDLYPSYNTLPFHLLSTHWTNPCLKMRQCLEIEKLA